MKSIFFPSTTPGYDPAELTLLEYFGRRQFAEKNRLIEGQIKMLRDIQIDLTARELDTQRAKSRSFTTIKELRI